jgi:hypothetical protein
MFGKNSAKLSAVDRAVLDGAPDHEVRKMIADRNREEDVRDLADYATPAWYYGLPPRPWFEFCL